MQLNILAFGIAKDIIGNRSTTIQINECSVGSLMQELERRYPELKRLASYLIAVNQEYAEGDVELRDKDEIAIIPPVSGG